MSDGLYQEKDYADKSEWVRVLVEDANRFMRQWDFQIGEELDFAINQNHYDDDEPNSRDRRRIKPKDPSLMALIRHKTSQILKASRHFDVYPVDTVHDPMTAEYIKTRLRLELEDPDNNYREVFTDVVSGALAARMWAAEFVNHPDCGMIARPLDPRRLRWHPGFKSPHDKGCPWVAVQDRIPLEEARAMAMASDMFTGTEDEIKPDTEYDMGGTRSSMYMEEVRWRGFQQPKSGDTGQKFVTIVRMYFKYDKKTIKKRRGNRRMLQPGDRYMHCQECDYQSPPQHAMDTPWPPQVLCPECGGTMERIDALDHEDEYLQYKDGRRLIICFPYSKVTLHDGEWEFQKMRNWPVVLYKSYWHPILPVPMSDTAYYRTLQLMIDSMIRLGFEAMLKGKGWMLAPENGLIDAFGNPWQFSDYQDVAYYTDMMTPGGVQWFQGPQLNPGWSTFLQSIQGAFSANKGTGDIGLAQGESKDIAVGTINTLVQTGEIPVDNHIADFQVFMSRFLTRLFEAIQSADDKEMQLAILGPQGMIQVPFIASAQPMVDIVVTAEPDMTADKFEVMDKFQKLAPVLMQNPALFQVLAKMMNLPQSLVEQFIKASAPPPAAVGSGGQMPQLGPGMPPGPGGPPMGQMGMNNGPGMGPAMSPGMALGAA